MSSEELNGIVLRFDSHRIFTMDDETLQSVDQFGKLIDDGGGAPVESGQVDPFGNDSSDGDFDPDDIDNADDDRAVGRRTGHHR